MNNISVELHEQLIVLDKRLKRLNHQIPIHLVRNIYDDLDEIVRRVKRCKDMLDKEKVDVAYLHEVEDYSLLLKTISEKIERIVWVLTELHDQEILDVREDIENMLDATYVSSTLS